MTDREKLVALAKYFDAMDALSGNPNQDVQKDLRRIAESLEAKDAEIAGLRKALEFIEEQAMLLDLHGIKRQCREALFSKELESKTTQKTCSKCTSPYQYCEDQGSSRCKRKDLTV